MELQARIGIRVREIRRARDLTQEAVADLIGRSVDAVSLLERGKAVPGLDTLQALSLGLRIPLRDLLDLDERPPKDEEVLALQTAAIETIRRMNKAALSIAVKQLDALADFKAR